MNVELVWATPDGDDLVAYMARVSNPANQNNKNTAPKLIKYLIDHKHWSPFEMVNACVKIETTRDIAHQLIRHRSFSFQEYSGRYAEYGRLETDRECRLQDQKNRQASLPCDDVGINDDWTAEVENWAESAQDLYSWAISVGIAKEVARSILPEGLTPTVLYMNGTLRSWIHYWEIRCTPETQKEHRNIAEQTQNVVTALFPSITAALQLEK